ncbi:hypothetical protein ACLOJK_024213 [Asimina triloba]
MVLHHQHGRRQPWLPPVSCSIRIQSHQSNRHLPLTLLRPTPADDDAHDDEKHDDDEGSLLKCETLRSLISPSNHPNDVCFIDVDASIAVRLIRTADQLADVNPTPLASTPSTYVGRPPSSIVRLHRNRCRLHVACELLLPPDAYVDPHRHCTICYPCQLPLHVGSSISNVGVGMTRSQQPTLTTDIVCIDGGCHCYSSRPLLQ